MSYPERDMQVIAALNQTWERLNTVSGNRLPPGDKIRRILALGAGRGFGPRERLVPRHARR